LLLLLMMMAAAPPAPMIKAGIMLEVPTAAATATGPPTGVTAAHNAAQSFSSLTLMDSFALSVTSQPLSKSRVTPPVELVMIRASTYNGVFSTTFEI